MTDIDLTAAIGAATAGIKKRLKWASNHWNAAALDPAAHIYLASAALEAALPHIERQLKPSREDLAGTICSTQRHAGDRECENDYEIADAILALLPGKSEAEVKAEALREAAGGFERSARDGIDPIKNGGTAELLRIRAETYESE